MQGLRDLRVVDFSNRIAGAYATKLLADAYAEVIKVEPPSGDALRRWTASDQDLDGKNRARRVDIDRPIKRLLSVPLVGLGLGVEIAEAFLDRPVLPDITRVEGG